MNRLFKLFSLLRNLTLFFYAAHRAVVLTNEPEPELLSAGNSSL